MNLITKELSGFLIFEDIEFHLYLKYYFFLSTIPIALDILQCLLRLRYNLQIKIKLQGSAIILIFPDHPNHFPINSNSLISVQRQISPFVKLTIELRILAFFLIIY